MFECSDVKKSVAEGRDIKTSVSECCGIKVPKCRGSDRADKSQPVAIQANKTIEASSGWAFA